MEDHEIVDLFWKRSETAITQAAQKYGAACKQIAYNILKDPQDAEECVNDTYMNAWNSIPPQKPRYLYAYLAKITRNLSFNAYKRKHTRKRGASDMDLIFHELEECIPSANVPQEEFEMHLLTEQINAFLHAQPEEMQIVFVRRYWYSDSIQSISQDLNMSQSKVKSILFRCREKLREQLEKEGVQV